MNNNNNLNDSEIKYDAFISYRHLPLDMYVARTLHKTLESFVLPKKLRQPGLKDRITRVFRDRDELPLSNNLSEPIELALKTSEYMIVICTPKLKESEWCKREINTFKELHGQSKIMAVLAEGEPEDSFPIELLVEEYEEVTENGETVVKKKNVEPLAADVRGKNHHEINKKIKEESLRIVAPMFGLTYDSLKQRHRERKIKRIATISSIVAAVFLVFGIISTSMAITIFNQSKTINNEYAGKLAEEAISRYANGEVEDAKKTLYEAKEIAENPDVSKAESVIYNKYTPEGMLVPEFNRNIGAGIDGMVASKDMKNVVICDNLGRLLIFDTQTGEYNYISKEYGSAVFQEDYFTFIDDNHLLYSLNGKVCIYNVYKNNSETIFEQPDAGWSRVLFDENNDRIFILSDKLVCLDAIDNSVKYCTEMDVDASSKMALSSNGERLIVSGSPNDDFSSEYFIVEAYDGNVLSKCENIGSVVVKIAEDNNIFYEITTKINIDDKTTETYIVAIDSNTDEMLWKSEPSTAIYFDIKICKNGLIYAVSPDSHVTLNSKTGEILYRTSPVSQIMAGSCYDNGCYSIARDGSIYNYNVESGAANVLNDYAINPNLEVRDAIISDDAAVVYFEGTDYIAVYRENKNDDIISLNEEDNIYTNDTILFEDSVYSMYAFDDRISSKCYDPTTVMYYSPDKTFILEFNRTENAVRKYDVSTSEKTGEIEVDTGAISSVFLSDDNKYIGVTKLDGELLLFDAENYNLIKTFKNDFCYVNRMGRVSNNTYVIDSIDGTYIVDDKLNELFSFKKTENYYSIGYDPNGGLIVCGRNSEMQYIPME